MNEILESVIQDYDFYLDKINRCAGYIIEKQFALMTYSFDEKIIFRMRSIGINLSDFSPYVNKLCKDDYSKLLIIILFAFNVEI